VVAAAAGGEQPREPLCMDLDATLITAHSDDKDGAEPTYKRTFGFHPLLAYLDRGDGVGESLGRMLRPGNAGANTAADHIDCFEAALWQLEGLVPEGVPLVVRADTAGCSHAFLDWLAQAGVGFSVGFPVNAEIRAAIRDVSDDAWVPARRQDGSLRNSDGDQRAAVAELTDSPHVDLSGCPPGSRLLVRREPLHPGAQQTLEDIDGCRFTCLLTDQPDADRAGLNVRHRGHARVEDRIRGAKDTGARTGGGPLGWCVPGRLPLGADAPQLPARSELLVRILRYPRRASVPRCAPHSSGALPARARVALPVRHRPVARCIGASPRSARGSAGSKTKSSLSATPRRGSDVPSGTPARSCGWTATSSPICSPPRRPKAVTRTHSSACWP
jgi:hypothetical protein